MVESDSIGEEAIRKANIGDDYGITRNKIRAKCQCCYEEWMQERTACYSRVGQSSVGNVELDSGV